MTSLRPKITTAAEERPIALPYRGRFGDVRSGPVRQSFWAVWDRPARRLHERTRLGGGGGVVLERGRARVKDRALALDLRLEETAGVETVSSSGESYGGA